MSSVIWAFFGSAAGVLGYHYMLGRPMARLLKIDGERDEMRCDRCGRYHNVVWYAPSDIWNAVMRDGDRGNPDEFPFCCPECFIELAEERGIDATGWCLSPDLRETPRAGKNNHSPLCAIYSSEADLCNCGFIS